MRDVNIARLEKRLGAAIEDVHLLKQTSSSLLYHIKAKSHYVLKKSRTGDISEEFHNHQIIYRCWRKKKDKLDFRVPEVHFRSRDKLFYIMEYIKNGVNFLHVLMERKRNIERLFKRAGRCLYQYHELATYCLARKKKSIWEHNTVRQLMRGTAGNMAKKILSDFEPGTYRIIYKDFRPSNLILDEQKHIYFIDFQNIYYYAPYYYDLARFIDTGRVFTLVRKPTFYMRYRHEIDRAMGAFLEGYCDTTDPDYLRKMQYFHRLEHVEMKANFSRFDSMMLRMIYKVV